MGKRLKISSKNENGPVEMRGWGMEEVKDGLSVRVLDTMVVDRQAREINGTKRWLYFETLDRFSTGELLVCVWMVPDENYVEGCFSGYRFSIDGGRTWSRRYVKGPMGWCKHAFKDGRLMELSYMAVADPLDQNRSFTGILTWLSEGGRKVCQEEMRLRFPFPVKLTPQPPTTTPVQLCGFVFCRSIIEMPEGDLLASMYGRFEGDELDRSILVKSIDQGRSWDYLSTVCEGVTIQSLTGDRDLEGANEPSVLRLNDGALLSVFRTRSYREMYQCWSRDGGKTWTHPVSAGVPGVLPKLLLLNNGVLACSYGRPGVHIMFSLDGTGREWRHHTDIPLNDRGSTCYTDLLEVKPGELLLLYDTQDKEFMDVRLTRLLVERT